MMIKNEIVSSSAKNQKNRIFVVKFLNIYEKE